MSHRANTDEKIVARCWSLAPEGAVVHRDIRTAVIADVHLGYEWARAGRGDMLPAHSLAETRAKLTRLLARESINRLIVAGDLVESAAPCERTAHDVRALDRWLSAHGTELVRLQGNHDSRECRWPGSIVIDGWTIAHGDRAVAGTRSIVGHHHPVLAVGRTRAACFLVTDTRIVLPAFSADAAGWNVMEGCLPRELRARDWRCVGCAGEAILDFGLLTELRTASRRAFCPSVRGPR
jgi:putative SbcD/Mre11-related phosphoesterase